MSYVVQNSTFQMIYCSFHIKEYFWNYGQKWHNNSYYSLCFSWSLIANISIWPKWTYRFLRTNSSNIFTLFYYFVHSIILDNLMQLFGLVHNSFSVSHCGVSIILEEFCWYSRNYNCEKEITECLPLPPLFGGGGLWDCSGTHASMHACSCTKTFDSI